MPAEAPKLRLALLGCGRIAQVHWSGIQESAPSLIHVVACIDLFQPRAQEMADRLAASTGEPCSAFTSLAEALASGLELDAVDIMLLHNQHEAAALEAFDAGLHVMLEKPMSITPESCGRVLRAARATSKEFWIAEQEQYNPAILTAQRLISEGEIGDTITLHTMGGTGRPASFAGFKTAGEAEAPPTPPPKSANNQGTMIAAAGLPSDDLRVPLEGEESFGSDRVKDKAWRADKTISGGGVIIDGGSHTIRPMRMMMAPHCGNIVAVAAVTEAFDPDREGENYTRTLMRFENGQTATLEMGGYPDAFYGPTPWRHRVLGTKGEVRVVSGNHGEPDIVLYNEEHPDGKLFEHPVEKVHHGLLLEDFARTILHGETRGVRAADSLGESLTAMAIYRANDSGQWEDVFSEAFTTAAGAEAAQTVAARL